MLVRSSSREGKAVKTDVLALIERVGPFICLPESKHDVSVREKVRRVGLHAANLGVSEGLEKSKKKNQCQ
jgi:hypothetical protein